MKICNVLMYDIQSTIFIHKNGKKTTRDIGKAFLYNKTDLTKHGKDLVKKIIEDFKAKNCELIIKEVKQ